MSVGERIAKKRMELGLNQSELALRSGLKPAAINQYESGERKPSYEALIKLAGALKVSTDFLISGSFSESLLHDPTAKTILKTLECLPEEKRGYLLNLAFFLLNHDFLPKYPILDDVADYAEALLRDNSLNTIPVNVGVIVENLNLKIIETVNSEYEGVLIKESSGGTILLDGKTGDFNRRRFTIAHLLGHFIIPWHMKSVFYCRRFDSSTLKTEDTMEMEANRFASALLMPGIHLEKDLFKKRPTLEQLESLAHKKYEVSLFALANRLIEFTGNRHALINSENNKIKKVFQGNRPVVESLHPGTFAAGFFANPPTEKTALSGYVLASYWLSDASFEEKIYEESMYNPKYKAVLTLLTSDNTIRSV